MLELEAVTIGHYYILRRLAKGGMSQIYLARDTRTGQMVAIKLVHCEHHEYYIRFQREVTVTARLQHEHILPALDCGEFGDWYYLVTPYIEYGTLTRRLSEGPLTLAEVGSILTQLASALQYAHEHGILHRDIKPANILLDGGSHVYLADFGLAQLVGTSNGITQTDFLIGTAAYMAPELAEHPATTSSDIYALGILLYQMLTGILPFSGSTSVSTFLRHIHEQAKPPSHLNPAIPYGIEEVILCTLAKEPRFRFATPNELVQAYQQALAAKTTRFLPVEITIVPITSAPFRKPAHPQGIRHKAAMSLLIALICCIMPLMMGFSFSYFQDRLPQTTILNASIAGKITHMPGMPPHRQPKPPSPTGTASQTPSQNGTLDFSSNKQDDDASKNQGDNQSHNTGNSGKGKGHGKGHTKASISGITSNGDSPLDGFDI